MTNGLETSPLLILASTRIESVRLMADRPAIGGVPAAHGCHYFFCDLSTTHTVELGGILDRCRSVTLYIPGRECCPGSHAVQIPVV